MSQKDKIITLLTENTVMTQGALAEAIYGDKNHSPYIHSALMSMVENGIVIRSGNHPSYYSLSGVPVSIPKEQATQKKEFRDVSFDVITNESNHII